MCPASAWDGTLGTSLPSISSGLAWEEGPGWTLEMRRRERSGLPSKAAPGPGRRTGGEEVAGEVMPSGWGGAVSKRASWKQ